jgi:BirA family transcriptional regulator, biotin operon repressor / biotin---[acetyl-CoA-carboxylase] ligase
MTRPADPAVASIPLPEGFVLHALAAAGSTNDEARRLAEAGAPEGTVVWAREQTAGRGRHGRPWASPPGNLYCSIVLRPDRPPREAAQLAMVAGCALADALDRLGPPPGLAVGLKWPNDLLLGGAKAAGILLEASGGVDERCDWLIVGTGVNVASCPVEAAYPATCLAREGFRAASVEALLAAYLGALDHWLRVWRAEGLAPVRAAWLARAHGLGGPVTLRFDGFELHGRFAGLSEGGALVLREEDGRLREVAAGDVFFREQAA